jgi:hypothetical protein
MLPKSQHRSYVRYKNGSQLVIYYNAAMRKVLTLRNHQSTSPSTVIQPTEDQIVLMPTDMYEGEKDWKDLNAHNSKHSATKRKSDQVKGSVSKP